MTDDKLERLRQACEGKRSLAMEFEQARIEMEE